MKQDERNRNGGSTRKTSNSSEGWSRLVTSPAGEAFCNKTTPQSKLRGVFYLKDQRIKELRDEEIVAARHVDTERNLADLLTKGLSATVRNQLDQEMDRLRLDLIKLDISK